MAITSLQRNFTAGSGIVYMQSSDTYATVIGATYLDDQAANIIAFNMGAFDWIDQDIVVAYLANGVRASFLYDEATNSLVPDESVSLYAKVAITAAQFNGMYAAPKLLVAAPGANRLYVVDKAVLAMTYGSAAYAAGGVVALQYDSTVHGAGVLASATVAAASFQATASTSFAFAGALAAAPFSTTVNKALYLSNQTAAFTTGDSPFVAHIWYRAIATA